jgi:hypothetical protein
MTTTRIFTFAFLIWALTMPGYAQLTTDFQPIQTIQLPVDSADLASENAARWNRPSHIEEGRTLLYVYHPKHGIYTVDRADGSVSLTAVDKEFKLRVLGKVFPNPEEMYEKPLPAGAEEMEAARGGAPNGFSTIGDTLYFTYIYTYAKKIGGSSVPQIQLFLVGMYKNELLSAVEIDHGFVMSIDMPVYFLNPSMLNFYMTSPTSAIFTVTSMIENRPYLFAEVAPAKGPKWEIKKVLAPKLALELVNEEKSLTILAAGQSYIHPPFMGNNFSNEVWTYEKKSKVFTLPTDGEPELGITMRLGQPVPPKFAVIDLIPVTDQIAHTLLYEKTKVYLQGVEVRKGKELFKKPLLTDPINSLEDIPVIALLSNNQVVYFDGSTSSLHIYKYE